MPHPRGSVPAFSQKSMITSSITTPSKIEKLISGVKAANVMPLGGGLVVLVVLLYWLVLLLLNNSVETLEEASALTGLHNCGMISRRGPKRVGVMVGGMDTIHLGSEEHPDMIEGGEVVTCSLLIHSNWCCDFLIQKDQNLVKTWHAKP